MKWIQLQGSDVSISCKYKEGFNLLLCGSSPFHLFLRLTHLSDAELVQAFVMSKNCNLIGHSSAYTGPIINLGKKGHDINGKNMDANQNDLLFFNVKQPHKPSRRRRGGIL